jgi:hypothetical protein
LDSCELLVWDDELYEVNAANGGGQRHATMHVGDEFGKAFGQEFGKGFGQEFGKQIGKEIGSICMGCNHDVWDIDCYLIQKNEIPILS